MRTDFDIPGTYTSLAAPQPPTSVPIISNGTLWSNEDDTMWLYGGESSATGNDSNDIWRFEPERNGGTWTALDSTAANLSSLRPTHGAGCNVPNHATGYYLGGYLKRKETDKNSSFEPEYLHSMTVFNMNTESTYTFSVPIYVPIIDSSLVYLNAGI